MTQLSDLPKVCACIGDPDEARAAEIAVASYAGGQTMLELRLDMLADPRRGPGLVDRLTGDLPGAPILATCRRAANGGRFGGSIESQVAILRSAVQAGAGIVDVEIETIEQAPGSLDAFRESAATLASYHNFSETPPLEPVLERLRSTGADILKVATQVRGPSDNLRLLALCEGPDNIVVAGMGDTGSPARMLSPARGGLFTFAGPDPPAGPDAGEAKQQPASATAPGQFPASVVRTLYRVQNRTPETKTYAVIAKPVGHSKSPLIHNRAFGHAGFDGIYLPLMVEPSDVADFFVIMRSLPISGASVTIPHKQAVIPFLDSVDPVATGIGAVNTVYWKNGKLVGTNTDAVGVTTPLARRIPLKGAQALVVGNGGAAKAAVVSLRQAGCRVGVTGRNPERVRSIAQLHDAEPVAFEELDERYFDVLVQSTPVGMYPEVQDSLFPGRIPADIVFDLVYNPLETALLKHARDESKDVICGIEMFIEQAAAQFEIWTGLEAPREVMERAVLERTVR